MQPMPYNNITQTIILPPLPLAQTIRASERTNERKVRRYIDPASKQEPIIAASKRHAEFKQASSQL